MPIATRSAKTTWTDSLAKGRGVIDGESHGIEGVEVTWASRIEDPHGRTSPEELCAAAHSSCFAMALGLKLAEAGLVPQALEVEAAVTLEEVGGVPTITRSKIAARGRVEGLDEAGFSALVAEAALLCPVSRLFAGADVVVDAGLLDA
ncbi:MAG: OsmC family peroxiredoxin [Actinobacteria bacterium]|nr:OsmC family peroxiredoxin [Actinomycetota bacterium]OJU85165.1 MAG: osmotically inducible protein OsmC [Solirubrobacterales bacterium 70-9]